ncbi:MAG: recombinase family protein [Clostridia bacterium]|nr:recombinase family protein [Clostridia bacterium]
MLNVVAYCRVSTDEKDQLNSLQTQKEFFGAYAQKNGMHLLHIYSDQGISGTKTKNRAAFNQMMHDAESRTFQAVLIKDVSRLARNTLDFLDAYRRLLSLGIDVQFLNGRMSNMGGNEFMLTLLAAMAQEESRHTSQRIKFSKRFNAEKGKVPNLIFGYDKINGDYFHLNINEKEAETVRMIFRKYTEEGDGTLKIAQILNGMGITTKRGCKWSQNAVARILSHPIYIGKIVNGKQEIVNFPDSKRVNKDEKDFFITQNPDLKIIDEATFEKAQRLLEERSRSFQTNKTRHSNRHLLSTLIQCEECGYSFRRISRTYQNTYVRWSCSGRNQQGTGACPNAVQIDEDVLISEIRKYFSALLSEKEKYIRAAKEIFLQKYAKNGKAEKEKESIEKRLSELQAYREKLICLFTNDMISLEELQKKLSVIKAESLRLEYERQAYSREIHQKNFENALDSVFRNTEAITDIRALSNAKLKEIIREIKVDKEGYIDIYLNAFT